jgi:ABC-type thiamine transport system substrate-binding protein
MGRIAICNHYYMKELANSDSMSERLASKDVELVCTDGAFTLINSVGILKQATNPDLAQEFIDFLLSDLAQYYLSDSTGMFPIIKNFVPKKGAYFYLNRGHAVDIDQTPIHTIASLIPAARQLIDEVGF